MGSREVNSGVSYLANSELCAISDKSILVQRQVSIATGLVQCTSGDAALLPAKKYENPENPELHILLVP